MNSHTMSLRDGKNIAFSDFGNTYIPLPPIDEQTRMADYLDAKCAEILSHLPQGWINKIVSAGLYLKKKMYK